MPKTPRRSPATVRSTSRCSLEAASALDEKTQTLAILAGFPAAGVAVTQVLPAALEAYGEA